MTKLEWKEFWQAVDVNAADYDCKVYKLEANGGWRVLVLKDEDDPIEYTPEAIQKGALISGARYGFRSDEGQDRYVSMLKIQWGLKEPVPFGMSKTRTVYVSEDPAAVFAMLYT